MPTTCTVQDTGGVETGNAVCVVGFDTVNNRPFVARALRTTLAVSKTVYGVARTDQPNNAAVAVSVAGEVADASTARLGTGPSRLVVSDYHHGTVGRQCKTKRIDAAATGDEAFVVGTCDTNGNLIIQPRHATDETALNKVFNVRAYGAVGNGLTDDHLAFQAALNAAAPYGGTAGARCMSGRATRATAFRGR